VIVGCEYRKALETLYLHILSLLDNHTDGTGRIVLYPADIGALDRRLTETYNVLVGRED
jgi:hypothetical protein